MPQNTVVVQVKQLLNSYIFWGVDHVTFKDKPSIALTELAISIQLSIEERDLLKS